MKAIRIHQHGGPEVLQTVELPLPALLPDCVLVRNQAVGVNYVDVQHRQGGYYPVQLPLIPGIEAAGIIEQVGASVTAFKIGDRVAYAGYMGGNYAQFTPVPQDQLVPLPDTVDSVTAAAGLLQAMTAHCLTHDTYLVRPGDTVLVHAAAGGVGSLLVQFAKRSGAVVIATVSTPAKAEFVRSLGADHIILYRDEDFAARTNSITNGEGVHVVYDAIGRATFDQSLASLRRRGYMVVYGQTSGAVPPFDINRLSGITDSSTRGAIFLTWAALSHYNTTPLELRARAATVLQSITDRHITIHIGQQIPLEQAAQAHRLMEQQETIGKIVLVP